MENSSAKVFSRNFQYSFPADIRNAFRAFETSWETDNLESEDKRNIYCELIDWGWNSMNENKSIVQSNNITTDNARIDDYEKDDDDNKHKITIKESQEKWWTKIELKGKRFIEPLSLLAMTEYAKGFRYGNIDERIRCNDYLMLGNLLDLNIPLENLIELENEIYWRRVVESKIQDKCRLVRLSKDSNTIWKKIGIEILFTEFIEGLEVSDVESPKIRPNIDKLTEKCVDFIENLSIRRVNVKKECIKNIYNPLNVTRNYKNEEVKHISLEFLAPLKNLKNFSISFDSKVSHEIYERRFYQVSIESIENFSKGLKSFVLLETLEVTKTDLREHEKLFHLLSALEELRHLSILTLTHCNISSRESGNLFKRYLSINLSLKQLNLQDNALDSEFCCTFALGIEEYTGTLSKLNLSMNPIPDKALASILSSISKRDNVIDLDISSCRAFKENSHYAFKELSNLIAASKTLHHLDISNNQASSSSRKSFVKALEKNFSLDSILYSNCDFNTKEELNIHVLLMRNGYYRQNKILKKETFTLEDEIEIEKWLRRVKHPLLVNAKPFMPTENSIKWKNQADEILCSQSDSDYEKFTYFYSGN